MHCGKQGRIECSGAPFETSLAQIPGSTETYFCVLTRAHAYDITCLKQILQKPAAYVGMMGSRGRSELVRRQLAEAGLDPARVARLHAPIALPSGQKRRRRSRCPFWHRSWRSKAIAS